MKRHPETRRRAKELRAELTPAEQKLWQILRAGRAGVKFQRQVVIAPYIADFASRSSKLVIELDGETHVGREDYDERRTAYLEMRGYRVLRFTNSEMMKNPEGVMRAILVSLGRDPEAGEGGDSPLSLPVPLKGARIRSPSRCPYSPSRRSGSAPAPWAHLPPRLPAAAPARARAGSSRDRPAASHDRGAWPFPLSD